MYKCVDLIANVFGKNSETSFFEGRGTMQVHCSTEEWQTLHGYWVGQSL